MIFKSKKPTIYFGQMQKYKFKKGNPPKHITFFIPHVNEYGGVRIFKEVLNQRMQKKGIKTETIFGPPINNRGLSLRSEIIFEDEQSLQLINSVLCLEDYILRLRTWKNQIEKYGPKSIVFEMHSSLKVSEKTKIPFISNNRRLSSTSHFVILNPLQFLKEDISSIIKVIRNSLDEGKALLKIRNLSFKKLVPEIKRLIGFLTDKKHQIKAVEFAAKLDFIVSNPELFDLYYHWKDDRFLFAENTNNFELNYCAIEFKPSKFFPSDIELIEKVLVLPNKR